MSGIYTQITEIIAPDKAVAGTRVDVTIAIKNKYSASVHVAAIGVYDAEVRFINWLKYWIPAGATHSFAGSFIMPDRNVTIHAYSCYEGTDGYWYYDDEASKDVQLELLEPSFSGLTINFAKTVKV